MTKKDITTLHAIHPWHERYICLTDELPPIDVLQQHRALFTEHEIAQLEKLGDLTYEPGKWTIKEMLQHLIDTERVLSYRAMCIARNEQADLPNYDEAEYGQFVDVSGRNITGLLAEFDLLRQASSLLYQNFTVDMLRRVGTTAGKRISVLAIAYVLAGHPLYHLRLIKQKYLPLLQNSLI